MDLFRYNKSLYGGDDLIIGASFDLLKWFAAAALVFIVVHAVYMAVFKSRAKVSH